MRREAGRRANDQRFTAPRKKGRQRHNPPPLPSPFLTRQSGKRRCRDLLGTVFFLTTTAKASEEAPPSAAQSPSALKFSNFRPSRYIFFPLACLYAYTGTFLNAVGKRHLTPQSAEGLFSYFVCLCVYCCLSPSDRLVRRLEQWQDANDHFGPRRVFSGSACSPANGVVPETPRVAQPEVGTGVEARMLVDWGLPPNNECTGLLPSYPEL